jgi:predicted Fe-S protein YdhL (DUF1289 family)
MRPLLMEPTPSPCTGVCRLDAESVCLGCGRRIEEIAAWGSASEARKREIVALARQRSAARGAGVRA